MTAAVVADDPKVQKVAEAWVDRADHGDQVAESVLKHMGERVRSGDPKYRHLRPYYDAALNFMRRKGAAPAKRGRWWVFGRDGKLRDVPTSEVKAHGEVVEPADRVRADGRVYQDDPESVRPPLPVGALDAIWQPAQFANVIVSACRYRHGLDAAGLVIANGPALSDAALKGIIAANFASAPLSAAFIRGISDASDTAYHRIDPSTPDDVYRAIVTGQCLARARCIQTIRNPARPLGGVVGWENGE